MLPLLLRVSVVRNQVAYPSIFPSLQVLTRLFVPPHSTTQDAQGHEEHAAARASGRCLPCVHSRSCT